MLKIDNLLARLTGFALLVAFADAIWSVFGFVAARLHLTWFAERFPHMYANWVDAAPHWVAALLGGTCLIGLAFFIHRRAPGIALLALGIPSSLQILSFVLHAFEADPAAGFRGSAILIAHFGAIYGLLQSLLSRLGTR